MQLGMEKGGSRSAVTVEFSQEGLARFLGQLDAVQGQLDKLS